MPVAVRIVAGLTKNKIVLHGLFDSVVPVKVRHDDLLQRQKVFGYSREDIDMIIGVMAKTGYEPTGSMGNDAALAVLSEKTAGPL